MITATDLIGALERNLGIGKAQTKEALREDKRRGV